MLQEAVELFEKDITANNARPYHRSFWFFLFLRLSQHLNFMPARLLCKLIKRIVLMGTSCELPASAIVGGGCYIPHFNGIVISPYARIGANVKILQQVTIGVDFDKDPFAAPKVGNGALLGAGAKIIGDVDLGDDCKVGANAVVTRDVPVGKTVIGANNIV